MTQDGSGLTYTFDAENRLTLASGMSGGPYCYVYDGNGLRVAKKSGASSCSSGTVTKTYWRSLSGDALAEIGLPPGADVDRASLDALTTTWNVQSYEIQPDRLVFYLWPRAGGTTFSFSLKPRFAMAAQSVESLLYDYYNPAARASVPPATFSIH